MLDSLINVRKVDKGVVRLSGMGVFRYLFIGSENSVLMDTGYGLENLPAIVETYVDSPLRVVNSHYHPDHSGGNYRYKEIYIHEKDVPHTGTLAIEEVENTILASLTAGSCAKQLLAKGALKFLKFRERKTKYIPVKDGHTFDLGDRKLTLKWVPGHTEGSCALLDKERHNIYTGDACNPGFWMWTNPKCSLSEYADNLDKFYNDIRGDGYVNLYNSHTPFPNKPEFIKDYAAFARSIEKGSTIIKFHLPGYANDALCIKAKPSLKHLTLMFCFYFESQAAGEMPEPKGPNLLQRQAVKKLPAETANKLVPYLAPETAIQKVNPFKVLKYLNPLNVFKLLNPKTWLSLFKPKNIKKVVNKKSLKAVFISGPKGIYHLIRDIRQNGAKEVFSMKNILNFLTRRIKTKNAGTEEIVATVTLPRGGDPIEEEPKTTGKALGKFVKTVADHHVKPILLKKKDK